MSVAEEFIKSLPEFLDDVFEKSLTIERYIKQARTKVTGVGRVESGLQEEQTNGNSYFDRAEHLKSMLFSALDFDMDKLESSIVSSAWYQQLDKITVDLPAWLALNDDFDESDPKQLEKLIDNKLELLKETLAPLKIKTINTALVCDQLKDILVQLIDAAFSLDVSDPDALLKEVKSIVQELAPKVLALINTLKGKANAESVINKSEYQANVQEKQAPDLSEHIDTLFNQDNTGSSAPVKRVDTIKQIWAELTPIVKQSPYAPLVEKAQYYINENKNFISWQGYDHLEGEELKWEQFLQALFDWAESLLVLDLDELIEKKPEHVFSIIAERSTALKAVLRHIKINGTSPALWLNRIEQKLVFLKKPLTACLKELEKSELNTAISKLLFVLNHAESFLAVFKAHLPAHSITGKLRSVAQTIWKPVNKLKQIFGFIEQNKIKISLKDKPHRAKGNSKAPLKETHTLSSVSDMKRGEITEPNARTSEKDEVNEANYESNILGLFDALFGDKQQGVTSKLNSHQQAIMYELRMLLANNDGIESTLWAFIENQLKVPNETGESIKSNYYELIENAHSEYDALLGKVNPETNNTSLAKILISLIKAIQNLYRKGLDLLKQLIDMIFTLMFKIIDLVFGLFLSIKVPQALIELMPDSLKSCVNDYNLNFFCLLFAIPLIMA